MDILGKIKVLQGERGWSDYKLAQKANIPIPTLNSLTLFCIKKFYKERKSLSAKTIAERLTVAIIKFQHGEERWKNRRKKF